MTWSSLGESSLGSQFGTSFLSAIVANALRRLLNMLKLAGVKTVEVIVAHSPSEYIGPLPWNAPRDSSG